jgi:hypothetical protein
VLKDNEDFESISVKECRHRSGWPKWKDVIQSELNPLTKCEVFGPIVLTPEVMKPIGYKWVFVRKQNENNKVVKYKARLVAQGFLQKLGVVYDETHSLMVDAITLWYLVSLTIHEKIDMRLIDIVTAYLYGNLDNDIYMKVLEGFNIPEAYNSGPHGNYFIKLQRSLYGLKQSGRMGYNRLSKYLLKLVYKNDLICSCIFIKKSGSSFVILAIYVDDINLIRTPEELQETKDSLKWEFEIKDFKRTKFWLSLQIKYLEDGMFIYQSAYTTKVLKTSFKSSN